MNATDCPDKQSLADYASGKLPEDSVASIEGHLALCPQCEDTFQALEAASNTLISGLRSSDETDPATDAVEYRAALERVARLSEGAVAPVPPVEVPFSKL